jgi:hypothetical protein
MDHGRATFLGHLPHSIRSQAMYRRAQRLSSRTGVDMSLLPFLQGNRRQVGISCRPALQASQAPKLSKICGTATIDQRHVKLRAGEAQAMLAAAMLKGLRVADSACQSAAG